MGKIPPGVVLPAVLSAMASDGTQKNEGGGTPNLAESGDRAPGVRLLTA